jgi:hypothetical protein
VWLDYRLAVGSYLIPRYKLEGKLEIFSVFSVKDIDPSDEVLVAKLEVRAAAAADQPDAALLAHLADDDEAVAEVNVALGQPFPVVH